MHPSTHGSRWPGLPPRFHLEETAKLRYCTVTQDAGDSRGVAPTKRNPRQRRQTPKRHREVRYAKLSSLVFCLAICLITWQPFIRTAPS